MSRERESTYDIEIGKKIKRENEAALAAAALAGQIGRQQQQAGSSTLNTITPCAACKLLRRRCAEECPFSPYFSPHEPQKFAAVHKVFGASNVSKMLMEVAEIQRADAANSLVYEANVRLRDPVYGCMGAISALQQQVQLLQAELNAIRTEIFKYKYTNLMPPPPPPSNHNHNHNHNPHHPASAIPTSLLVSSAGNLVSVAALPPSTANLPAQLSLPPPSTVVVSSTSSPSSSLSVSNSFATKSSGYNNNNIANNGTTGLPYFG